MAAYKRAIWMAPKHAGYHFFLGQLLHDRGDVDAALKAFYGAIENLKKNQNDGPSTTQAHYLYNYGLALLTKGDVPKAKRAFERCVEIDPCCAHQVEMVLLEHAAENARMAAARQACKARGAQARGKGGPLQLGIPAPGAAQRAAAPLVMTPQQRKRAQMQVQMQQKKRMGQGTRQEKAGGLRRVAAENNAAAKK